MNLIYRRSNLKYDVKTIEFIQLKNKDYLTTSLIFKILYHVAILATLLLCTSCHQESSNFYTIVEGNVDNAHTNGRINIKNEWVDLEIKEDGSFSDTLDIASPQYVSLTLGDHSTRIYIGPGDKVTISLDSVLAFGGSNNKINDYLYQYNIEEQTRTEVEFNAHEKIFKLSEEKYIAYRDSIKKFKLNQLSQFPNITEAFRDFHRKDIEYQFQYDVARYPNYYSYYFNDYEPTALITEFYKNVPLDNNNYAQNYEGYRSLVNLILDKQVERLSDSIKNPLTAHLTILKNFQSPLILHSRLERSLYYFTPNEKNMEAMRDRMISLAKLDKTKEAIIKHYEVISKLKPGTPAPNFNFENNLGGKTKLTDLKGKYIYIDVWATWCGPCIKELPYLKKIEDEFQNSNIEFVSISVDEQRSYNTWKQMIKDEAMGGVQLLANNGWNSSIIKDYGIQGIPHFILIDDMGNIVSASAPRPSHPELKQLLNTLLK